MKILLTGGTGLIGSQLVRLLLDRGHQVVILTRNLAGKPAMTGVQYAAWDGKIDGSWVKLMPAIDAVVNLAGENIGGHLWTPAHKELVRTSRVQAGKVLVEAIRQSSRKPDLFIQSSAIGYYGPSGDQPLGEDAPSGRDWQSDICREWEGVTQPLDAMGIRRLVIRSGVVLSLDGGAFPRLLLPFKLFAGGPIGSGRQWLSWIHWRDEIEAISHLIHHTGAEGVYNLTAPEAMSNAEFGRLLGRVIKRPYWFPTPGFAIRLVLGEMSTLVLDGQRVFPQRLIESGFQFRFAKVQDALMDLFK
jgi:uncharacterized protein (TIGR01777 family)